MAETIASIEDVKLAGNISARVDNGTVQFYLEIASTLFARMVGLSVYAEAITTPPTLDSLVVRSFMKSEALMAVGLVLPALAMSPEERGLLQVISHGAGGQLEKFSFVKEVQELAATFMNLAQQISQAYIIEEGYELVWHQVIMRMFPSLDEIPTVGMIGSEAEALLQAKRGYVFVPTDSID